jgi:hypothetical protein
MADLERPDAYISLIRAAVLSGRSPTTIRAQALRGRLHTVRIHHGHFTTRRWLHEYLLRAYANDGERFLPVPESYVPPE